MNMQTMRMLGAATAALGLMATVTPAHADVKCRSTVIKESAKLTQAIAKNLQKCEQAVHDGKASGPCLDTSKITDAKAKLVTAVVKACATSTGEFAFGRCPNETGSDGTPCSSILINSKTDVGLCLACLADHNASELVHHVLYGSLVAPANKTVGKCQSTIGKSTVGFYASASKILSKCQASLLNGKVTGCPDSKTTDALAKAEAKKQAAIAKACCGPDGVCGGATCSASAPHTICMGGTNDGRACDVDSACPGGGTCIGGSAGAACDADRDCGRCRGGGSPDKECSASGQCEPSPGNCNTSQPTLCVGGTNHGAACTVASQCPGGSCAKQCVSGSNAGMVCTVDGDCPGSVCQTGTCTGGYNDGGACTANADCPSVLSGTCVGTTGLCGGSDDLKPTTDIGLPVPCPGLTTNATPIVQTGVTGTTLLTCVDGQANGRAACQDAAGATFGNDGVIPGGCTDAPTGCVPSGGTQSVTVHIANTATPSDLGGISISLGYTGVTFPGVGDVSASPRIVNTQVGTNAYADNEDSLTLSTATTSLVGNLTPGALYTVTFDNCGAAPTASNFGCVVRSASDPNGVELLNGVTCSVTVP